MMKHYSVLLQESIDNLAIHSDGIYVDGTLGRGGHSAEILARIPQGHLYAFDRDASAIEESRERLAQIGDNVTLIHSNFSNLKRELTARGVTGIDGMVLDLGVSSPQFDEAQRGFSYRFDAPLDMRPRRGGAPGQQGRHKAQGQQLSFLHGTPSFYNMVCFLDGFWGKMFRGLKRFLKIFPLAP